MLADCQLYPRRWDLVYLWGVDRGLYSESSLDDYRRKNLDWLSPIDYVQLPSDTFQKRQPENGS